jgi:hypothetical protein
VSGFKWDLSSKKRNKQTTVEQIPYIFELKSKRRTQDNSEESKPAQGIVNVFWEGDAKFVCTTHRWRVAWKMAAEIHHPRTSAVDE